MTADQSSPSAGPTDADRTAGTDPVVVAWVVASCERQGVPVKVTDAAVVARVGVLLGAPTAPRPAAPAPERPADDDGIAAA